MPGPTPGSSASLLAGMGGQPGGGGANAKMSFNEGVESLREAAELDPRLAERIRMALEVLLGDDQSQSMGKPKVGPVVGDMKTPV